MEHAETFLSVKISDWVMISAVLLGPILAVQAQKIVEDFKDRHNRKFYIFRTLMATRATTVSPDHVTALNMIDMEFSKDKKKEKPIVEAWKTLLSHYEDVPALPSETATEAEKNQYITQSTIWCGASQGKLVDLLYAMSNYFKYGFDKVHLEKSVYYPKGMSDIELELRAVRKAVIDAFTGKTAFKMDIESFPIDQDAMQDQVLIRKALIETFKKPIAITIEGNKKAG